MCAVSFIGDRFGKSIPNDYPWTWPYIDPPYIHPMPIPKTSFPTLPKILPIEETVSKEEFNKLKKEIEELKKLLLAAKEYDKNTGQPDCEIDEKVKTIKKLAELVGVNMDEVFK